MKRGLCLIGLVSLLVACSGESGETSGNAPAKEDPAEQGAAEIARKADETVKQKIDEFDKQIAREMAEPEPQPVEDAASSAEAKADKKAE